MQHTSEHPQTREDFSPSWQQHLALLPYPDHITPLELSHRHLFHNSTDQQLCSDPHQQTAQFPSHSPIQSIFASDCITSLPIDNFMNFDQSSPPHNDYIQRNEVVLYQLALLRKKRIIYDSLITFFSQLNGSYAGPAKITLSKPHALNQSVVPLPFSSRPINRSPGATAPKISVFSFEKFKPSENHHHLEQNSANTASFFNSSTKLLYPYISAILASKSLNCDQKTSSDDGSVPSPPNPSEPNDPSDLSTSPSPITDQSEPDELISTQSQSHLPQNKPKPIHHHHKWIPAALLSPSESILDFLPFEPAHPHRAPKGNTSNNHSAKFSPFHPVLTNAVLNTNNHPTPLLPMIDTRLIDNPFCQHVEFDTEEFGKANTYYHFNVPIFTNARIYNTYLHSSRLSAATPGLTCQQPTGQPQPGPLFSTSFTGQLEPLSKSFKSYYAAPQHPHSQHSSYRTFSTVQMSSERSKDQDDSSKYLESDDCFLYCSLPLSLH